MRCSLRCSPHQFLGEAAQAAGALLHTHTTHTLSPSFPSLAAPAPHLAHHHAPLLLRHRGADAAHRQGPASGAGTALALLLLQSGVRLLLLLLLLQSGVRLLLLLLLLQSGARLLLLLLLLQSGARLLHRLRRGEPLLRRRRPGAGVAARHLLAAVR